jgi:DNA-binding transcriptional MerR regulator
MKPSVFQETAAAVAKRFGVSVKALRVYEDAGLLKPARTVAGWRIYRQPEIERLSAILALKQSVAVEAHYDLLHGAGDSRCARAAGSRVEEARGQQSTLALSAKRGRAQGKQPFPGRVRKARQEYGNV